MLEDVTVAWDGSERARHALDWVLVRRAIRSVRLVRVLPADDVGQDEAAGVRMLLDGVREHVRTLRPDLAVETVVRHGDGEQALLDEAVRDRVLVLGAGGRVGLRLPRRSAMLARVVRYAKGPVLVVPLHGGDPAGPVVAGVDRTAAGVAAAQLAAEQAVAAGSSVVLMRVRPPKDGGGWAGGAMDACVHELVRRHPHLLVRERFVRGDVHRELRLATTSASLLVLGRHPLPGPGAEVEHDAVDGTGCPLLLVREEDAPGAGSAARTAEMAAR